MILPKKTDAEMRELVEEWIDQLFADVRDLKVQVDRLRQTLRMVVFIGIIAIILLAMTIMKVSPPPV